MLRIVTLFQKKGLKKWTEKTGKKAIAMVNRLRANILWTTKEEQGMRRMFAEEKLEQEMLQKFSLHN